MGSIHRLGFPVLRCYRHENPRKIHCLATFASKKIGFVSSFQCSRDIFWPDLLQRFDTPVRELLISIIVNSGFGVSNLFENRIVVNEVDRPCPSITAAAPLT